MGVCKKILMAFVCAMVCVVLAPISASASLYVGGVEVTGSGEVTNAVTSGNVTYDAQTNTLTLDGAVLVFEPQGTTIYDAAYKKTVIYTDDEELKIVGNGTITGISGIQTNGCALDINGTGNGIVINTTSSGIYCAQTSSYGSLVAAGSLALSGKVTVTSDSDAPAIYAYGPLEIKGNDDTNITAQTVCEGLDASSSYIYEVCGIYSEIGPITINGGTVTAKGFGAGIGTKRDTNTGTGDVTIKGGTIYAEGYKYGIYSHHDLTITGGEVTGKSNSDYGSQTGGIANDYGKFTIEPGIKKVTAIANPNDSFKNGYETTAISSSGYNHDKEHLQYSTPAGAYKAGARILKADGTVAKTVVIEPIDNGKVLLPKDAIVSTEYTYDSKEKSAIFETSTWDGFKWSGDTKATNAGTYTIKASLTDNTKTWSDGTTEDKTYTWKINPHTIGVDGCLYCYVEKTPYTGTPVTPKPLYVKYDMTVKENVDGVNRIYDVMLVLKEDVDYMLSYENNIDYGEAKAIITMKGNYQGTDNCTFKIVPGISKVTLSQTSFAYNGEVQKPEVTGVWAGDVKLEYSDKTRDYTVKYSDENSKEPGTYKVTVKASSSKDAAGTYDVTYEIVGTGSHTTDPVQKTSEEQKLSDEKKTADVTSEPPATTQAPTATGTPKAEGTADTDTSAKANVVVTSKVGETPEVEYKSTTDTKAKSVVVSDDVILDGVTYKVTSVDENAFSGCAATKVILGKNIDTLSAKAFNKSKISTVVVKTKKLTKKSVKNAFKGSKAKTITVKVDVGSKKLNKKYAKLYKKFFTKKNVGKKVKVKY